MEAPTTECPGCAVKLPATDGPEHPYMTSSAACWARYGELLSAQYSSPERMTFHQLVVDAYAVQHPGTDDPRAIRSVAIHSMTLCLFVEYGVDPSLGPRLHRRMVARPVFHRLEPPSRRARMTLLDVPLDGEPTEARSAAYAWAASVWAAWEEQHPTVRGWLAEAGLGD